MDWFLALAITGMVFVVIGTLTVMATMAHPTNSSAHGWAFIVLGLILVLIFGVGPHLSLGAFPH